jgi:hypothetical protein
MKALNDEDPDSGKNQIQNFLNNQGIGVLEKIISPFFPTPPFCLFEKMANHLEKQASCW